MQALLDFMPLLAFMLAYKLGGIYVATAVLMAAMLLLLLIDWLRLRRIPSMHLLSTALVFVFGGATLLLRNPVFLKWKPTILLWLLAVAFGATTLWGRQPLLQRLLQTNLPQAGQLSGAVWRKASWFWVGFYTLLGALNLVVAYHFSESAWVNFKVLGLTAALAVFAVVQTLWLSRQTEPG
ncbi:MAG: inner membrane-spanning protein YciB [Steroidobacteraceae bacterium]